MLTSRRARGTDSQHPLYSARGNATTIPQPNDPEQTFTCVYDAWNRLVEVLDDSTPVARYRYDGLNRRIRKLTDIVEDEGDSICTVTEYYYNSSWQVLEERRESEVSLWDTDHIVDPAVTTDVYCQYVWSLRYIDSPVIRDRDAGEGGDLGKTGSGLDERLYYLTDGNMNVTALMEPDGDVAERYHYDPYGRVTVLHGEADADPDIGEESEWDEDEDGSDWDNEILYCGYRYDPETGLYHVRNRIYDPLTGRWLQRDPIGYADGASLYAAYFAPGTTDPYGFKKRAITVASTAWAARWHWMGEDIVGAYDLSALLEAIKEKVGKYDPKGEGNCNCLSLLKLAGHGAERTDIPRGVVAAALGAEETGWSKKNRIKGLSHQGDPLGERPDPKTDPAGFDEYIEAMKKRAKDPLAHELFLGSTKEFGELTPATRAFFAELSKLKCEDGMEVWFYSCNAAHGNAGKRMMRNVAHITGGKVTGYDSPIWAIGITPVAPTTVTKDTVLPSERPVPPAPVHLNTLGEHQVGPDSIALP